MSNAYLCYGMYIVLRTEKCVEEGTLMSGKWIALVPNNSRIIFITPGRYPVVL